MSGNTIHRYQDYSKFQAIFVAHLVIYLLGYFVIGLLGYFDVLVYWVIVCTILL